MSKSPKDNVLGFKMAEKPLSTFSGAILAGKWERPPNIAIQQFRSFASSLILGRHMCSCSHSLSCSLSPISYYTKLYANWLSDPSWYHFYFNWCNCYCHSSLIPLSPLHDLPRPRTLSEVSRRPTVLQRLVPRSPVDESLRLRTGAQIPSLKCLSLAFYQPHLHFSILNCSWHSQTISTCSNECNVPCVVHWGHYSLVG